jgi:hypothetical protein
MPWSNQVQCPPFRLEMQQHACRMPVIQSSCHHLPGEHVHCMRTLHTRPPPSLLHPSHALFSIPAVTFHPRFTRRTACCPAPSTPQLSTSIKPIGRCGTTTDSTGLSPNPSLLQVRSTLSSMPPAFCTISSTRGCWGATAAPSCSQSTGVGLGEGHKNTEFCCIACRQMLHLRCMPTNWYIDFVVCGHMH